MPARSSKLGVALVTGASSGIGASFARRLASDGYDLVLVARRRERLEALAEKLRGSGVEVEVLVADLVSDAGLECVEARLQSEQRLTLLVNNAGFAHFGSFMDEGAEKAEAGLRVLALATVRLTHAALPNLLSSGGGAVINISSRAAFGANPKLATYSAAKAYVNRFTLALADELEGVGVRFLAVCPGNVETELFEVAGIDPAAMRGCLAPEQVVDEALEALAAGRRVCVPGERRRDRLLRAALPHGLVRKLASFLGRLAGT